MGGSHSHAHGAHPHTGLGSPEDGLLVIRDTVVHRLPPQVKLVALVLFVLVVVATPAGAWWAFAAYAALAAGVVLLARIPLALMLRRMAVELPFVVFALVMPFVATGEEVDVLGIGLSVPGLLAAATMLVKATIGVVGAVVLASTTPPRELLVGLERLHLPHAFVAIISFMLRYLSVVSGDLHRMRVARESRGYAGGAVGHLGAVAAGAGSLFVRSYERGERVHHAMLARGYAGRMPSLVSEQAVTARDWSTALALPLAALAIGLVLR